MTGRSRRFPEARLFILAIVILSATAGCWSRGQAPAGTQWIRGTIRYAAQPLSHGVVQFFATDGSASGSARVRAGSFGAYLAPGKYAVAVIARSKPSAEDERGRYVPPTSLIPDRYGDIATSALVVEVGGSRTVALDLSP